MNFKKLLGALALMFVTSTAFAQYGGNPIWGRWQAINRVADQTTSYQVYFNFNPNNVVISVTCYFYDGAILQASTGAFASYGISNYYDIFIQQPSQQVNQDGFRFCRATLQPTRWIAGFDGFGRMILTTQVPFNSQFNLVRY